MFISYIFLQKKESHNFITETTSLYGWFLSIQARKPYKKTLKCSRNVLLTSAIKSRAEASFLKRLPITNLVV
jgi:hypothetical protein